MPHAPETGVETRRATLSSSRLIEPRVPRRALRTPLLVLGGVLLLGGAACEGTPTADPLEDTVALAFAAHGGDHAAHLGAARGQAVGQAGGQAPDLARMRAGTAEYQRFERAVADGFVDPSEELECVAHPALGGMGIHFVNFERYGTLPIDPSRPEILLYEPRPNGTMKLVGVEFAVNAEAWYAAGNTAPPSVAGVPYDPPNPEAGNPLVRSSYTLHVWTWEHNPGGMFAPFNPRVSCP